MMIDLILAILHHILAFSLFALIIGEAMLLRPGLAGPEVGRVVRLDAAVGGTAGLIVVVGILRVIFGLRGYEYYLGNHAFWGKMITFVVIALISIIPTRRFLAWRKSLAADPGFAPPEAEILAARRLVRIESWLFVLLIVFAATMARYG